MLFYITTMRVYFVELDLPRVIKIQFSGALSIFSNANMDSGCENIYKVDVKLLIL